MQTRFGIAFFVAAALFVCGLALTAVGLLFLTALPSMASADGVAVMPSSVVIALTWSWYLLPYGIAFLPLALTPFRFPRHARALALAMLALALTPVLFTSIQLSLDSTSLAGILPWEIFPPLQIFAAAACFLITSKS